MKTNETKSKTQSQKEAPKPMPKKSGYCDADIYIEPCAGEYDRLMSLCDICEVVDPPFVRNYIKNKAEAIAKMHLNDEK